MRRSFFLLVLVGIAIFIFMLTPQIILGQEEVTPTPNQITPPSTVVAQTSGCDPAVVFLSAAAGSFMGPSVDSSPVDELTANSSYPIIARAQYLRWWYIQLPDGRAVWVANEDVEALGDTAAVPVINPPNTPHNSNEWNILPNPECANLASSTATSTVQPTPVLQPGPDIDLDNPTLSNDGIWAVPVNVSRTATGTNAQLLLSENGQIHLIWNDDPNNLQYVTGQEDEWYGPVSIGNPIKGTRYLQFLIDDQDQLHVFGLDLENALYYSTVPITDILSVDNWQPPALIENDIVGFKGFVDEANQLHVAYLTQSGNMGSGELSLEDESPGEPGVYYRRSPGGIESATGDNGDAALTWSVPAQLFQIPFLQLTGSELINVDIGTDPAGEVIYVGWENPILEKVYLATSQNGGQDWNDAGIIDERRDTDSLGGNGPAQISIQVLPEVTVLVWQGSHGTIQCSQYYQTSTNDGRSWSEAIPLIDDLGECPLNNQMLPYTDDQFLKMTNISERNYFSLWGDNDWQIVYQNQPILREFVDQETFRLVEFGCHQAIVTTNAELIVIGCDTENPGLWLTWRSINDFLLDNDEMEVPTTEPQSTSNVITDTVDVTAVPPNNPSIPNVTQSGLPLNNTTLVVIASLVLSVLIIIGVGLYYRINAN